MNIQSHHVARLFGAGKTWFHIENIRTLHNIIRRILWIMGLYRIGHRNTLDLQVEQNEVFFKDLPAAFDGYRILHISDTHIDGNPELLTVLRDKIQHLAFDLCVFTGDFREGTFEDYETPARQMIDLCQNLNAPTYAVLGNHDAIEMVPLLEAGGIRLLLNERTTLTRDEDEIVLLGVDDPHYYEKFYLAPGDTGFMSVATSRLAVGPLVCWDQWYPEAARLTAMAGAQAIFYPTAIGWLDGEEPLHREQYESWDTMLRSHAIANGVFVVAVNRTGHEGPLRFWGASVVYAPNGDCLLKAPHDEPLTTVVDCDLDRIEWSRTRWPFFRDRRIDAYGGLTARFLDD